MIRVVVTAILIYFACSLIVGGLARAQADVMTGFACAGDAFKFCKRTMAHGPLMPDAIEACLRSHERAIAVECRKALNGHKRER